MSPHATPPPSPPLPLLPLPPPPPPLLRVLSAESIARLKSATTHKVNKLTSNLWLYTGSSVLEMTENSLM